MLPVSLTRPLRVYNRIIDGDQTQPTPNQPSELSKGEAGFGDSSGQLFSIYSNAAEDEDIKMVKRWHEDADGILIFVSPFCCRHSYCLVHKLEL